MSKRKKGEPGSEKGFPSYSTVKNIISKEEYKLYKDLRIDPVRIFKFFNRGVMSNLVHSSQLYGNLLQFDPDDIAMAIIKTGEFLQFERKEKLKEMEILNEVELEGNKVVRGEEIKGKERGDSKRRVGSMVKIDGKIKKFEYEG